MKKQEYRPEGIADPGDGAYLCGVSGLSRAMAEGRILQARCLMCDERHDLHLRLGPLHAIIEREEAALGIREGTVGDVAVITRVNKSVCFKVKSIVQRDGETAALLSRRAAQEECLRYIKDSYGAGDVIDARITHLEQFGAFADVGCGIVSMIPIDNISVSRIEHPRNRFTPGMDIKAVIKSIDRESGRINLTHKELLGTWEQNAGLFCAGQTVSGIVRSVESYGIFIELTPNLAGLSEYTEGVSAGSRVSVFIKSIIPEKMKVKLAIVDVSAEKCAPEPLNYFFSGTHMDGWRYSPLCCPKKTETVFLSTVPSSEVIKQ